MTEPTHELLDEAEVELRQITEIYEAWLKLGEPQKARDYLRRELVGAWSDGFHASMISLTDSTTRRRNPWMRPAPATPAPVDNESASDNAE